MNWSALIITRRKLFNSVNFLAILSTFSFFASACCPALFAADVRLTWDPDAGTELAGYRVYAGSVSRAYGAQVDIGNQTTFTFSGLDNGTYYFAVTTYDTSGNESDFSNEVYMTINPDDTTPPVVSAVQATNVTSSNATITWITDEPADSQVDYGTTTAYGNSTTLNTAMVASHSQAVSGLTAGTLYHYRVKSRDGAGNLASAGDFTFTTAPPPDTTAPSVSITDPASGSIVSGTRTVSANASDDVGVAGVQFLLDGVNLQSEDTTAPYSISWNTSTAGNGIHTLSARARDAAGNTANAANVGVTVLNPLFTALVATYDSEAGGSTGIAAVNLDRGDANLRITPLNGSGTLAAGKENVEPAFLTLHKGGQVSIVDSQIFGPELRNQNRMGWYKLESSTKKIVASFLNFNASMSVLDGVTLSSETFNSFVLPEIEDQGFTEIHLANPNDSPAKITFDLLKADGTPRAPTVARRLNGNAALAESFQDLFPNVGAVASDYIRVTSDQGVVPFQLLGKSSSYLETLTGQDTNAGATTLYGPQYTAGGQDWRSALSIVNLDSNPGRVTLRFISDDGMQIGSSRQVPISGKGKIHITDESFFVDSQNALMQGYAEISSDGPRLAGSIIFGDRERSTVSTALPLTSALQRTVVFSHLISNDAYFTSLTLVNPNDCRANATIDVLDKDGLLVATRSVGIPPRNRNSQLLTAYFPSLVGKNLSSGYIRVTSDESLASFTLIGAHNLTVLSSMSPQVAP